MLRPVIRTLTPVIRFSSIFVSVGSQGWILATDWLLTLGVPALAFNFIHHGLATFGLLTFLIQAQLSEKPLLSLDNVCQMMFVVASMVFFELVRQTDPGVITKQESATSDSDANSGTFHICDSCHVKQTYRSFHCRKCNHCVERFDQHCTWTNSCIGARNLRYLVLLLATSVVGLFFCGLQSFYSLLLVTELLSRVFFAGAVAFYTLLLYSVLAFTITLVSSIWVNVSSAEMKGKIHTSNDYLSLNPYFNAWDYGSDYNLRACFNAYAIERPRWQEPTHLQKLITSLSTSQAHCSPHQHSDACNHPPAASHTHDHSHSEKSISVTATNAPKPQNKPSTSRQSSNPVGDENV